MATRTVKYRTPDEELALRERHLRQALYDSNMRDLQELTADWNQRYSADDPITPLVMVRILIYMEHKKRFPKAHES